MNVRCFQDLNLSKIVAEQFLFLRKFLFHTSRESLITQVGVQKSSVFSEKSNLAKISGN